MFPVRNYLTEVNLRKIFYLFFFQFLEEDNFFWGGGVGVGGVGDEYMLNDTCGIKPTCCFE